VTVSGGTRGAAIGGDANGMEDAELIAMNERRKAQRLRALKGGTIAFNRSAAIDCRVRNMSPAGACLEVASQIGIPDEFVLVVGYDKISKQCHVIWRSDMRMGVEYRAA
jgi:hypothetical protein